MKDIAFTGWVVTADQSDSRHHHDAVPTALAALAGVPARLPFERTAGDEIQGLLASPDAVVAAAMTLLRLGGWHVGVGAGQVEAPLPASSREARGPAYVAARRAVDDAKKERRPVVVRGAGEAADTAAMLVATLAQQRTPQGWEVAALLAEGLPGTAVAARLGITPSAVSQRARRAHVDAVARGCRLVADLLTLAETP